MDILKTPHEMLNEEAGSNPAVNGWLSTPHQKLMEEAGTVPHLAIGGDPTTRKGMELLLMANGHTPPRFQYAEGGRINASFSQDEFHQLHPLFVALGLIDPTDNTESQK